jgi:hypothetical protein
MRTTITKAGSSFSIDIPPILLVACGMENEVELLVENKKLIIQAYNQPRQGWFDHFQPNSVDVNGLEDLPADEGDDEWVW